MAGLTMDIPSRLGESPNPIPIFRQIDRNRRRVGEAMKNPDLPDKYPMISPFYHHCSCLNHHFSYGFPMIFQLGDRTSAIDSMKSPYFSCLNHRFVG